MRPKLTVPLAPAKDGNAATSMGWTPLPLKRHLGAKLGVLSTSQEREGVRHEQA